MSTQEFGLRPSRNEEKLLEVVPLECEYATLMTEELVRLKDTLQNHYVAPELSSFAYDHACANEQSNRLMTLETTLANQYQECRSLAVTFFSEDRSSEAVGLSYIPDLHVFDVAVGYSANRTIINPETAVSIINDNTDIELAQYLDANITAQDTYQIAELLRLRADETNPVRPSQFQSTRSFRYKFSTPETRNIEYITAEQNGHTMRYVLDVHHVSKLEHGITKLEAISCDVVVDSVTSPAIPRVIHEVSLSGDVSSELLKEIPLEPAGSEYSYAALVDALRVISPQGELY